MGVLAQVYSAGASAGHLGLPVPATRALGSHDKESKGVDSGDGVLCCGGVGISGKPCRTFSKKSAIASNVDFLPCLIQIWAII